MASTNVSTADGGGGGGGGVGAGGAGSTTTPEWKQRTSDARRHIVGKQAWKHVFIARVLGSGCNGAVFEAKIGDAKVAVKVMYNLGQNTTLAANLHETEYRFLRQVPEHFNVVAALGVIQTSPLTAHVVEHLPAAIRDLVTVVCAGTTTAHSFACTSHIAWMRTLGHVRVGVNSELA